MKINYILYMLVATLIMVLVLAILWVFTGYLVNTIWVVWVLLSTGIEMNPIQKWAESFFSPIGQLGTLLYLIISFLYSIRFSNKIWKELEVERV